MSFGRRFFGRQTKEKDGGKFKLNFESLDLDAPVSKTSFTEAVKGGDYPSKTPTQPKKGKKVAVKSKELSKAGFPRKIARPPLPKSNNFASKAQPVYSNDYEIPASKGGGKFMSDDISVDEDFDDVSDIPFTGKEAPMQWQADIRRASMSSFMKEETGTGRVKKAVNFANQGKKKKKKRKGNKRISLPVETEEARVLRLIESALKNEKRAPYGRTKLMVVGEGRAGKTCTIKALLNQEFDPSEASTKGFDVKRVDASNWKEDNKSYLVEYLQSALGNEEQTKPGAASQQNPTNTGDETTQKKTEVEVNEDEVKRYGQNFVMNDKSGRSLGFSIWDFGGQKVFYTLHHMFLTEYGCYVLVFDVNKLYNKETRSQAIEYLRFWLFSKKIHAPAAPMIIVGTHADDLSHQEIRELDEVISDKILGHNEFNEFRNDQLAFFPIDNKSGAGVPALRGKIEEIVQNQNYVNDSVPVSFLRLLELLLESKQDYIMIQDAEEIMRKCGLSMDHFELALTFLNQRGLITYFQQPMILRRFVVLQPQWLINGITDVVFDKAEHTLPKFDEKFNGSFRKFLDERVVTDDLLTNIWDLKGYNEDIQTFFKNVMLKTSLMCHYNFDKTDSYLIPTLFTTGVGSNEEAGESDYTGPYFVLDFSGDYDEDVVDDDGKQFVRYLPFGVFERLVCLCVEHSATYKDSIKPILKNQAANLSFGVDIDFELRVGQNKAGEKLWIKILTEEDTSFEAARKLVKLIYSMIDGLKEDYFSKSGGLSSLTISLLLPSSSESKEALAEYNLIRSKRDDPALSKKKFRPSKIQRVKVQPKDFDQWFLDIPNTENDVLTDPNAMFKKLEQKDPSLVSMQSMMFKPLTNGLKYHCFLSYKQSSAIDMVGKQYYILSNRGYKCWYDQQFRGQITLENMKEGVKNSMCYMLFLSKDIFPSYYVEEEVKMAVALNKPIILLHHPSTGEVGYWQFSDYIQKAPEVLKPLFSKIESLELQRRHYLEEAVTEVIDQRLTHILSDLSKET